MHSMMARQWHDISWDSVGSEQNNQLCHRWARNSVKSMMFIQREREKVAPVVYVYFWIGDITVSVWERCLVCTSFSSHFNDCWSFLGFCNRGLREGNKPEHEKKWGACL